MQTGRPADRQRGSSKQNKTKQSETKQNKINVEATHSVHCLGRNTKEMAARKHQNQCSKGRRRRKEEALWARTSIRVCVAVRECCVPSYCCGPRTQGGMASRHVPSLQVIVAITIANAIAMANAIAIDWRCHICSGDGEVFIGGMHHSRNGWLLNFTW